VTILLRGVAACSLIALALVACSADIGDEPTDTSSEALTSCATVRCAAGYHCVAHGNKAGCVADKTHKSKCDAPGACGPALGMPNYLCPDGVTVAGPTGHCLDNGSSCGWEVISCP